MHDLEDGSEDDISVADCAVVILVNIAADHIDAVGFLGSRKDAVSGSSGRDKDHITAFSDERFTDYLAARFISEVADIVAANVVSGQVGARIGRELDDLGSGSVFCVCIVDAAHEAIFIIDI